ncbi:MAG: SGNH/GDSL hydrolase family protein [Chitinophagaceae bacterium]|nr:SGNH/GDSL hydrolase family protein [Oligoflexus sp.]
MSTNLSVAMTEMSKSRPSIPSIMQRPLIVGASVSADWKAKSPGKLLALRYTEESQIRTVAFGGKSGREVLKKVSDDSLSDRTAVIGLDLFFWDAMMKTPDESLHALNTLMTVVKAKQIPIILGEVPNLLPGFQPQAARLNEAMHKAAQGYHACTVVPFTSMLFQILREGALHYNGLRYGLKELIPDGLHIGSIASQYIADTLYDMLLTDNR